MHIRNANSFEDSPKPYHFKNLKTLFKYCFKGDVKIKDQFGVPEIYEQEAKGGLAYLFQDIKFVLKVPVVNFIFRTLALYRGFLELGWEQIRPNMLTNNMETAAERLRFPNISNGIQPKKQWKDFYDDNTVEKIRKIIFTFNYVNPKLLIIASAWAESLGGRAILGKTSPTGFIDPGIIPGLFNIKLVKIPQPPAIQCILENIMEEHNAFDVASDFRALANYPQFLDISWKYLKPYVGSDEYNLIKSKLKSNSIKLAHQMPFPVYINVNMLKYIIPPVKLQG